MAEPATSTSTRADTRADTRVGTAVPARFASVRVVPDVDADHERVVGLDVPRCRSCSRRRRCRGATGRCCCATRTATW